MKLERKSVLTNQRGHPSPIRTKEKEGKHYEKTT
jgi:hypothetical protein